MWQCTRLNGVLGLGAAPCFVCVLPAAAPVQMIQFALGSGQRDDQQAAMVKLINTIGMQPQVRCLNDAPCPSLTSHGASIMGAMVARWLQFFRNALDKLSKQELSAIGDSFHTIGALPSHAVWHSAGLACTARHCRSSIARVARRQNLSLRHLIRVGIGVCGAGGGGGGGGGDYAALLGRGGASGG
eukprot:COSAG01_NODE_5161_length_4439_cov_6.008291_6_plen_185_part_01